MRPPRPALVLLLVGLVVALSGCSRGYRSALLPSARPDAGTTVYTLDLPEEYEVLRVDLDVAGRTSDGTSSEDVPYVHVLARHRETGEQRLLIYERIDERRAPRAGRRRPLPAPGRDVTGRTQRARRRVRPGPTPPDACPTVPTPRRPTPPLLRPSPRSASLAS